METKGHRDAQFQQAFELHFEAVSRYCMRRLPLRVVDDAVARAFVVAWRKVDEMPAPANALPWLYRIASFEVSTMRRTERRLRSLRSRLNGLAPDQERDPDIIVVRRAEHETVLTALASLAEADREVILLRSYEELSSDEIAAVLGCEPATARKRLSRALQRLRKAAGFNAPVTASNEPRAADKGGDGWTTSS